MDTSPGKPRASILKSFGSATIPLYKPGPSAVGDVNSAISCMKGEPAICVNVNYAH